jgi:pyruvate-formate lyase-activating enzyme
MVTDPIKRAVELRRTLVRDDKLLVADFTGTLQGKDTSRVIDLMPVVGTTNYPFRAKVNVKEIDPFAALEYKVPFFDVRDKTDVEIGNFIKIREFDFPLWFKHHKDFKMQEAQNYNLPFILQAGGCNFHDGTPCGGCFYCFVDDLSNDGLDATGKIYLGIEETVDSMISATKKVKDQYKGAGYDLDMKVLRTSGGEPTIALDWILNLWREIGSRGLPFVGQIDSNLSTGRVVDEFEKKGIFEENTLEKLAEYPVKVLTALKGVSNKNLVQNVQSTTTIEDQEYSIKRFVRAGFDIYPQMYNPDPKKLRSFITRMDNEIENLSLRIHIGPLKLYGPNKARLTAIAKRDNLDPETFIQAKKNEWDSNYKESCEIMNKYLMERYGVGYREAIRSDVEVRLVE